MYFFLKPPQKFICYALFLALFKIMNGESSRPPVGTHRLLLSFFATCPHIGSQADRCVDRIGEGERGLGVYVVMILITLLFFRILKSLYADNHNNPWEERGGKGTDVPLCHSSVQRPELQNEPFVTSLLCAYRPKLLVISQKTNKRTMRRDSRSRFDGWKCWHNYHITETENNSRLDLKEDRRYRRYEGRLASLFYRGIY